jgi:insertion element IS1 protein InsB
VHGKQRYKCKACSSYFLLGEKVVYGVDTKRAAIGLYVDGSCIRAVARFFKVSHVTIQRWIRLLGGKVHVCLPKKVDKIEIDELYSFIGRKENRKWVWMAICRNTKRMLGFQIGGRGKKTLQKLYEKIKPMEVITYYTDKHAPYGCILPKDKHDSSKGGTNTIEGLNGSIRRYLARFNRRTVCYSKSERMLELSLNLLMEKFSIRYWR